MAIFLPRYELFPMVLDMAKVQDRKSRIGWLLRFLILSLVFWSIADQILTPDVIQGDPIVASSGQWAFFRGQEAYREGRHTKDVCKPRSPIVSRGCYTGYLLEKFKEQGIESWRECSPADKATCSLAAGIAWSLNDGQKLPSRPKLISTWSAKNLKFFFEGLGFGSYMKSDFYMATRNCNKLPEYGSYCLFGVGQYSFFKYRPVIFGQTPNEIFWGNRLSLYEFDPSLHRLQGFLDLPIGPESRQKGRTHESVLDCLKDFHDLDCISEKTRTSDI